MMWKLRYYFCEEYLKKVPDSKTFHDVKNMLTKLLNKKNIPIDMIEFEKKSKITLLYYISIINIV